VQQANGTDDEIGHCARRSRSLGGTNCRSQGDRRVS
jgi:hypothetical protein